MENLRFSLCIIKPDCGFSEAGKTTTMNGYRSNMLGWEDCEIIKNNANMIEFYKINGMEGCIGLESQVEYLFICVGD